MNNFRSTFEEKLKNSRSNMFGADNYDENRFGKIDRTTSIYHAAKKLAMYLIHFIYRGTSKKLKFLNDYEELLQKIWENVNQRSKDLIVSLMAFRMRGYKKVKLERNNPEYWKAIEQSKMLKNANETYDPHFMHFILEKFDLNPIGYNIKLYFTDVGIATDFIIEQYAYKIGTENVVSAESGDVVLDLGACWGDTALYFAYKVGENGQVYSFEFIPENIKLFNMNTALNPKLNDRIKLVSSPVTDRNGDVIYFRDNGPGSKIAQKPFDGYTGISTTITIDDFIVRHNITKVDFIKMDIEGAEPLALRGAIATIRKHKPKLAISIYHSMQDFVNIPNWILNLNLGYEIFIDHFTIHSEETVCFAKARE